MGREAWERARQGAGGQRTEVRVAVGVSEAEQEPEPERAAPPVRPSPPAHPALPEPPAQRGHGAQQQGESRARRPSPPGTKARTPPTLRRLELPRRPAALCARGGRRASLSLPRRRPVAPRSGKAGGAGADGLGMWRAQGRRVRSWRPHRYLASFRGRRAVHAARRGWGTQGPGAARRSRSPRRRPRADSSRGGGGGSSAAPIG